MREAAFEIEEAHQAARVVFDGKLAAEFALIARKFVWELGAAFGGGGALFRVRDGRDQVSGGGGGCSGGRR